jgi:hypothetical protein
MGCRDRLIEPSAPPIRSASGGGPTPAESLFAVPALLVLSNNILITRHFLSSFRALHTY